MKAYEVSFPVIFTPDDQITDYGAVGGGLTDNTDMFRLAVAAWKKQAMVKLSFLRVFGYLANGSGCSPHPD
ncbi:hypothetical protein [Paenibacillus gallinarum]|uniref:Uncharacterized protein n=1 Tax=Paenibacillus gallinarum TaxID=2762232 RepID=A0ABR8T5Z3_9BACL|nr:hypothetical protein [Paenibacillus gallinarum]MBD7971010.1 hypothetical protein [Paenibacillus gallinarum]